MPDDGQLANMFAAINSNAMEIQREVIPSSTMNLDANI